MPFWANVGLDHSMIESYYGYNMFDGCEQLEGGKGTKYNPLNTNYLYAQIDRRIASCKSTIIEGVCQWHTP